MKTNSVENKNTFKIALFSTCPIYGKLKIDKENKGLIKTVRNYEFSNTEY